MVGSGTNWSTMCMSSVLRRGCIVVGTGRTRMMAHTVCMPFKPAIVPCPIIIPVPCPYAIMIPWHISIRMYVINYRWIVYRHIYILSLYRFNGNVNISIDFYVLVCF